MKLKLYFHYISYLQYPLMILALYFAISPYFNGLFDGSLSVDGFLENINSMLLFMGLGLSFSTLQDTTKTQNKLSKNVWESPRKGKIFIVFIALMSFFLLTIGALAYFSSDESKLKDVATGIIVLGVGQMGVLKAAVEMFEHHRKDRKVEQL